MRINLRFIHGKAKRGRFQIRSIAERTDPVDRAGISAFRGMTSLQPARQLIQSVRPSEGASIGRRRAEVVRR